MYFYMRKIVKWIAIEINKSVFIQRLKLNLALTFLMKSIVADSKHGDKRGRKSKMEIVGYVEKSPGAGSYYFKF